MTHHLRYARGLTAGATLSSGTAAYLATTNTPLWCLPAVYVAALLAWCAQREYACHRAVLVDHEQARRKAQQPEQADGVPCCSFWRHSDGAVHGPGCQRAHDPTAELNAACCDVWFVSRGSDHGATCSKRDHRSPA